MCTSRQLHGAQPANLAQAARAESGAGRRRLRGDAAAHRVAHTRLPAQVRLSCFLLHQCPFARRARVSVGLGRRGAQSIRIVYVVCGMRRSGRRWCTGTSGWTTWWWRRWTRTCSACSTGSSRRSATRSPTSPPTAAPTSSPQNSRSCPVRCEPRINPVVLYS